MTLHIKSPGDAPGVYPIVRRGQGLKYLSFTVIRLGGSLREHVFESGEEEISLDFYSGPVRVESEGWSADVPAHIPPTGAMKNSVGKDNWSRTVYTHIGNNLAAAHLICGETINRPGGWSSCPPHKHDRFAPPSEVPMEEAYYFLVEPRQGFGFMRVYTDPADPDPFDHAYAVENGDTVLIPRGYHPVVACPGYTLNYTWVLAGEGRTYGAWSDDPKHAWIKTA